MTAAISGTNTNVTNVSSLNEETSRGVAAQFASRSQRLLFENIPDVTVTIDPLTEDRTYLMPIRFREPPILVATFDSKERD